MAWALAMASSVVNATCCGLGIAGAQSPRRSGAVLRVIRTLPVGVGGRSAADQTERRGELDGLARDEAEHRAVEQCGLVEVVDRLGERDPVGPGHEPVAAGTVAGGEEVGQPAVGIGARTAEEDGGAVGGGDRAEVGLLGLADAGQDRGEQLLGPLRRTVGIGTLQPQRADRGRSGRHRPVWCGVQQDPGTALLPQLHGLGAVLTGVGEPEGGQRPLHDRAGEVVDRELGEHMTAEPGRRREAGDPEPFTHRRRAAGTYRLLQGQQRAHPVDGGVAGVGLPVDVVEHLKRQRAVISGAQHVSDEAGQVERAQAREEPVVAAPLDHVHGQPRRVGQLHVEDLGAGDDPDAGGIVTAGQDVEAVQAQAEGGMAGVPNDAPGVRVGVDEAPPRQRFVGDAQTTSVRPVGQRVQLLRGQVVVVHGVGGDRRGDDDGLDAEPLHEVELVLGPAQVGPEDLGRDRLEVAKRLVDIDGQPSTLALLRTRSGDQARR